MDNSTLQEQCSFKKACAVERSAASALETGAVSNGRRIHLICNAHLDPVWLWPWQEGLAEALSTFRIAAELCRQYETFIFNHNEARLYKWVEEYEPELFREIRELVRAGRWHIMGGWYIQPDCNMPCGEAMIRQIQMGRHYFKEKFGVVPTTAINFDPFGHSRGLVQILKKCGYDSYLFGRPQPKDLTLPGEEFHWLGYDGSQVLACRFGGWYSTALGQAAKQITERMQDGSHLSVQAVLWGVGNHGGGPSRKDLEEVDRMIKASPVEILHSTPECYFQELIGFGERIPSYTGELNPWGVGCYSSQVRIKQKYRKLENEIFLLEKAASTAAANGLMAYPYGPIAEATEDLLMAQFHDILPGTSTQVAEQASLQMLDHGLEITSRFINKAFIRLCGAWPQPADGRIPLFVYNPHPYKVRQLVEVEFNLPDMKPIDRFTQVEVHQGPKALPTQVEKEDSNHPTEWRKKIVFDAELEPGQVNYFSARLQEGPRDVRPTVREDGCHLVFENDCMECRINRQTGWIDSYRVDGVEYVKRGTFEPIVLADDEDPWKMYKTGFTKQVGAFSLMSADGIGRLLNGEQSHAGAVRVIEAGPVRTIIEVLSEYRKSFLCTRYKLPAKGAEIELELLLNWQEPNCALKLNIPVAMESVRFTADDMFGIKEFAPEGTETVGQKWFSAVGSRNMLALVNDGIYSADQWKGNLRLTLLRSPVYTAHPGNDGRIYVPCDRYVPRVDHGVRNFRLWMTAGKRSELADSLPRIAAEKNEPPIALSFYSRGKGKQPLPVLTIDSPGVQMTALRFPNPDDNTIICRLFEATGSRRQVTLESPLFGCKLRIELSAFEVKTIALDVDESRFRELAGFEE